MVTVEERARQASEKWQTRLMEELRKAGFEAETEEELWKLFPEFLRWRIEEAGEQEAQDWDLEAVKEYLYDCRVKDFGNPAFQTKYAEQEFANDKVLIKCIGGKQLVANHQWFRNIPPDLKQLIEAGTWEDFVRWMYREKKIPEETFLQMRGAPFVMRWTKEIECPSPPEKVVRGKKTKK